MTSPSADPVRTGVEAERAEFAALKAPYDYKAYEDGYDDGGGSALADLACALAEHGDFPNDVDIDTEDPSEVARYVAGLHAALVVERERREAAEAELERQGAITLQWMTSWNSSQKAFADEVRHADALQAERDRLRASLDLIQEESQPVAEIIADLRQRRADRALRAGIEKLCDMWSAVPRPDLLRLLAGSGVSEAGSET